MKKIIAAILSLSILGAMSLPALAQGRDPRYGQQTYSRRYESERYDRSQRRDYDNEQRGFWNKHQDKLTTALGALGGAIVGGAIGGGRGAAIGTLVGGGGSALYSYKLRDRRRY
jgi:uncharacterized protein YcfJ